MAILGTTYYISASGNDSSDGRSADTSWKTFGRAAQQKYVPGDRILLKCGDVWNEELNLGNARGSEEAPLTLSSYGAGPKPRIRRHGVLGEKCLFLENPSHWIIHGLDISHAMEGIVLHFTEEGCRDIIVASCDFHDITGLQYPGDVYDGVRYISSAGIMIAGKWKETPLVEGLTIEYCRAFEQCNCLWWVTGMTDEELLADSGIYAVRDFTGRSCYSEGGSFGWWMFGVIGGRVVNTVVTRNGETWFHAGTTGAGIEHCRDVEVARCEFSHCNRPDSPDGCGLDLEGGGNENIRVHDCVFKHNDSNGIMLFKKGGGSRDCVIEDCLFIDNFENGPDNLRPFEILFSPGANERITVRNNLYHLLRGVGFTNGEREKDCVFEDNQQLDSAEDGYK